MCERDVPILHQKKQQLELQTGKMNVPPCAPELALLEVQLKITCPEYCRFGRSFGRTAAQDRAKPGYHLSKAERRGNAIVRSRVQRVGIILRRTLGSKHDNAHVRADGPDVSAGLYVFFGLPEVKEHQIEPSGAQSGNCLSQVIYLFKMKSRRAQGIEERLLQDAIRGNQNMPRVRSLQTGFSKGLVSR